MINMNKINKRGITPVIATVLLISIVVVLIMIIYVIATTFVRDEFKKLGTEINTVCEELAIDAYYSSSENALEIKNNGQHVIMGIAIDKIGTGSSTREEIKNLNIAGGETKILENMDFSVYEKIIVIPIVIDDNKREITCKQENGKEIFFSE